MVEDDDDLQGEVAVGPNDGLGRWEGRHSSALKMLKADHYRRVDRSFPSEYR